MKGINKDKAFGAYIGAAIGDAMGGPVECSHAARIKRTAGKITGLLPYNGQYSMVKAPHPGYAMRTDAGAVTDDTFIRADLTRYYTDTSEPRDAASFAQWLLANADFAMWWKPAVQALKRVENGEVTAENGGMTHKPGGGVGWWTPIGILNAGDPRASFDEARRMCTIWKDPLEQDILAAVQAGVAAGMADGATTESVVNAILEFCGPLARKFLVRGVEIGNAATSRHDLIDKLYANVLVDEQPDWRATDPQCVDPLEDTDKGYASCLLCEQIPLALAAFVFADSVPARAIPLTVMVGRDCDTTATTVGSWCGAIHGESGLLRDWVETVCTVNMPEMDIRGLLESLLQ